MSDSAARPSLRERRALTFRLLQRAGRYRGLIALAFGTMLLAGIADTVPILLAKVFVGRVLLAREDHVPSGPLDSVLQRVCDAAAETFGGEGDDPRLVVAGLVAAVMVVVAILGALTTYANEFLSKYLASLIVKDLRVELLARIVRLPFSWFSHRKMGDLVSRFSNDTTTTYQCVNLFLSELLLQPVVLVSMAATAVLLNWRFALAALVCFPIVVWPVLRLGRRVHSRSRKTLVTLGETMEAMNQTLSGLRVVKAFQMEDAEVRDYEGVNREWLERQASLLRAKALGRGVMELVWGLVLGGMLFAGSWLVVNRTWGLLPEDFVSFLIAVVGIYRPLKRLSSAYNTWQASIAAAGRVFEVIDAPAQPADPPDAATIGPIREGIVFERVAFAYQPVLGEGDAPPVLRSFDLNIPARTTLALVGPSGAGKSTVANLLLRFYEPSSGRILVDGTPLDRVARSSLLAQVALVSQQPFLFNASIRENISYGRPGASRDEIEAAARAAFIHEEIMKLPRGYDTLVGERGANLSGGQLQRITIARAILKDASLLVLDEATSSLDSHSERAVQQALDNLLRGRTALVIAHRLSTVARADRICVLDGGRIIETGTHEELLALRGSYHRLYAMQSLAAASLT